MKKCAFILTLSAVVAITGFVYLANSGVRSFNSFFSPVELSFNIAEASCSWSTGYYLDKGKIKSSSFSTGECTWYVDGKEGNNGWTLYFSRGSSRNAYQWYKDQIVVDKNGNKMGYGSIGYPGEIMVFNSNKSITNFENGHVAFITSRGYARDGKRRAWTVRHANFGTDPKNGQTIVESYCGKSVTQCTFIEDPASSGKLKVVLGSDKNGNEILGSTGFPLLGFIYKK